MQSPLSTGRQLTSRQQSTRVDFTSSVHLQAPNCANYLFTYLSPEIPQPEATLLSISTKMEEDGAGGIDGVVTEFNTYEDFLDSQITPLDLYYLEVKSDVLHKNVNLRVLVKVPKSVNYLKNPIRNPTTNPFPNPNPNPNPISNPIPI